MREWRFTETLLNCTPVEVKMMVTVNFTNTPHREANSTYLCGVCDVCTSHTPPSVRALSFSPEKSRIDMQRRQRRWQSDCTYARAWPLILLPPLRPISDFRVEKSRAEATLTLSNGMSVRGFFFVSGNSRTHQGPESVKDVLNSETGILSVRGRAADGAARFS